MSGGCSTCGEAREWEGTDSGVRDWKVQEKGQVVILTRLHGAERIHIWFSIERDDLEDEDEDDEDEDDQGDGDGDEGEDDQGDGDEDFEDEDDQGEDDGGDEDEDDDEDTVTCRISFYKPENGAILVTALAREDSFDVRAIAHSRNARIAMEHTAEVDWQCRRLYYGRPDDLGVSRQAFDSYLLNRGINGELASYVMRYAEEKERKEETEWFQNVETFIHN